MEFENKKLRDVADIAARIMSGQQPVTEKLHPNQQQLDVHEPEKDELTADDFKKLRAGKKADVKKEEVEELDEDKYDRMLNKMLKGKSGERLLKKHSAEVKKSKDIESGKALEKHIKKYPGVLKTHSDAVKRYKKIYGEEAEHVEEVKMADLPSTKVQGRSYGASKPEPHAVDTLRGPKEKELKDIDAEKKKKKFSEMVNLYQNGGMKSFMEVLSKEEEDELIDELSKDIADYTMDVIDAGEYTEVTIGEEASQEEFNTEIEKAKAKSQGKEKAEVSKGSVQAVKQEETEITDEMIFEVLENAGIDFESLSDNELQEVANEAYEIIKERQMTDTEMKKREDIVKGMKKGMAGFKERYGDKAKNVMYATANKQAMKD